MPAVIAIMELIGILSAIKFKPIFLFTYQSTTKVIGA